MPKPIELLTIIAAAKKETAKAVKDAMPEIADMVRSAVDAKEIKTIADTAITINGDKGDKGDKGDNGIDGKDGRDGKDGLNGRDGKDGANGKDGKDGKDAIAKDGKDGRNGANGKDGVGVSEVAIGDDGHLYVGLSNGKVIDAGKARGDDGKPGKDGKIIIGGGGGRASTGSGSGTPGADGASAYDLAVTAGFSGTVEEWLDSLVGPQGPQGIQGIKGDTGDQGPQGSTGPVGDTGPQGLPGADGAPGATGPAGPNTVAGLILAGTNVTLSGSGTTADPMTINAAGVTTDPLDLTTSAPTVPPADTVRLFRREIAGRQFAAQIGPSGMDNSFQPILARNKVGYWCPPGNATTVPGVVGFTAPTVTGFTATARTVAVTNMFTRMRRLGYVTAATAGTVGQFRTAAGQYTIADMSGLGGFFFVARFGISDAASVAGARMFFGMRSNATPTNVEPSTLTNCFGVGHGAADTNLKMFFGGSAAQTPVDLGADFPIDGGSVNVYELALYAPANAQECRWEVTRVNTGHAATGVFSGTVGTQIPAATTLLCAPWAYRTNNATALAVGMDVMSFYIETDY